MTKPTNHVRTRRSAEDQPQRGPRAAGQLRSGPRAARHLRARRRAAAGVTFLELLVTVAIVAILAAIAIPSYTQYIIRTNRSAAKSMLLQVADRQEQFFADNKRYATDMTDLGYSADGFMIDNQGRIVADASADRIYNVSVGATATTFTVSGAPQLRQAARDTACGTFTLTQTGQRGAAGANCW